jgi:ribosomal protein S18 acetylase RimI-like enzyme
LTGPAVTVRPREGRDLAVVSAFLEQHFSRRVARLGELVDALAHPGLVAEAGRTFAGLLTFVPGDEAWEVLTLHAAERRRGAGTALVEHAAARAWAAGARRLWLITTNDNVDALRFYQRRGFRLAALNAGAVDVARRTLKPAIPVTGEYGIPIRDELMLERRPA